MNLVIKDSRAEMGWTVLMEEREKEETMVISEPLVKREKHHSVVTTNY